MSTDVFGLWTTFAAGVNGLAGITLLVLYPRSRQARWFSCFSLVVAGLFLAWGASWPGIVQLGHAAPAAFVGFALSTRQQWPPWSALAGFAVTLAVLEGLHGTAIESWATICAWLCGTVLLMRCSMPAALVGSSDRTRRAVFRTLSALPLVLVAGVIRPWPTRQHRTPPLAVIRHIRAVLAQSPDTV